MKFTLTLSIVTILFFSIMVGCGNNNNEHTGHENKNDKKEEKNEASTKNAAKDKSYPLDFCIVSNEKLGSMGNPISLEHEGQEVKVCCKGCIKTFKKTPEEFVKKIAEAKKNGKASTEGKKHEHDDHEH